MKFLHLADLHIGKRVCEHSMLDEQVHILGEVLDIARKESPDAVLIAGDVYVRSQAARRSCSAPLQAVTAR